MQKHLSIGKYHIYRSKARAVDHPSVSSIIKKNEKVNTDKRSAFLLNKNDSTIINHTKVKRVNSFLICLEVIWFLISVLLSFFRADKPETPIAFGKSYDPVEN